MHDQEGMVEVMAVLTIELQSHEGALLEQLETEPVDLLQELLGRRLTLVGLS
jgi:hypothetical protein